jgi:hypothetical protein
MDQEIRNKLRNVVTQCRKLLEDSVSQELEGKYGIFAKKDQVTADPNAAMTHLTEEEQAARKDILDHFSHIKARGFKPKEALEQLVREIAFTHLNRLCAYKMMEAREVYIGGQKFREAVSRGINSNGVKFYLADYPEEERLFNTGHQDIAYRHFLDWLGNLLSDEIGVLFNPNDPANRLYPRQKTLDEVLDLLNGGGIKPDEAELREAWSKIWLQDETIGWVYQYFTPKELRDAARDPKKGGSAAPRNSYELAFRNQFFTPRYVVEFLTDNTLGRIWYEMQKGNTKLKDQCRYIVRRPSEIFLKEGEQPPKQAIKGRDDLPQEDLLKLPVQIPYRSKKDPRELKILDPACGSGHFLLYCFDLLLTIYLEAYADPDLGPALQKDYPKLEDLRRDVPRLILAYNVHGIDIDLRCSQIAALALWLRCQRAYQEMGLKKDRPKITRSNFACAEPMPGEAAMLKEFVGQLEPKLLGQVVEVIFDRMKLAGEAGSLLKIEEEIREAVAAAKKQWVQETTKATDKKGRTLLFTEAEMGRLAGEPKHPSLFDLSGISDNQFFEQAEARVIETLRQYAEKAQNGQKLQRRLFTEDAVRGFAFVDLCHKRYDAVLMNPPFGESSKPGKSIIDKQYTRTKNDLYAAFTERGLGRLHPAGLLGAITSRTGFFLSSFQKWREEILLNEACPTVFADLGYGVLDTAMVETAAYCIEARRAVNPTSFLSLLHDDDKAAKLAHLLAGLLRLEPKSEYFVLMPTSFAQVPGSPFAYWVSQRIRSVFRDLPRFESEKRAVKQGLATADDFRFIRCWWEVPPRQILDAACGPAWRSGLPAFQAWCRKQTFEGKRWIPIAKGGTFAPFFDEPQMVVNWERDGAEIKSFTNKETGKTYSRPQNTEYYFRPGLTWPLRGIRLSVQAVPAGACFSIAGKLATSDDSGDLFPLLGLMNSVVFDYLVGFFAGKVGGVQYEVGLIGKVPVPKNLHYDELILVSKEGSLLASFASTFDECRHLFVAPRAIAIEGRTLIERVRNHQSKFTAVQGRLARLREELDQLTFRLYEIGPEDRESMQRRFLATDTSSADESESADEPEAKPETEEISALMAAGELVSCAVGSVLGRWDVRFATERHSKPESFDPFNPLPVCSPGMLQGPDRLPLPNPPPDYPLRIAWEGILVDDADHPDDVVRRVRDVLEIIWKGWAEATEKEVAQILEVKEVRDYFRRPAKGGFWDDHVSRYSKSRRKAPVYWLLQSSKKNYALWVYYHRLNKDLLFKALVNYIEPKIRLEASRLETLRSQKASASTSKEAKRLARELERQEDFLSELRDFEDKLRRAANLHLDPDLNDGVVLNIAPLWELVPWKEAKNYWDELIKGEYEWSSIGRQLRQKGLVK